MVWFFQQVRRLQQFVALPPILTAILVVDVLAYFGGLLYWYGFVMAQPLTPVWAWPFIPDCPLFGLLGGLGLLMVTAQYFWREEAVVRGQRRLLIVGGLSLLLFLSAYLPGVPVGWQMQRAMLGVWSVALLLCGLLFQRSPAWLLAVIAVGQIKYGVWTITAWLLFWKNTAAAYGAPLFTPDSVFMTITHIGLVAQGLLLLTYFQPTWVGALASLVWFTMSDYADYGLGWYPALPLQWIPLVTMQWSTVAMTWLLSALLFWLSFQSPRVWPVDRRADRPQWAGPLA